jgi:hypothetical protein
LERHKPKWARSWRRGVVRMSGLIVLALAGPAAAQQATFRDPLVEHMQGSWVMEGTIAGKPTIHDVTGEWVLEHQYMRLHEVSRDKKPDGQPGYEAMIFIAWDGPTKSYSLVWLDDFGDVSRQSLANSTRAGDALPFVFHNIDGSTTRTTFTYLPDADRWTWTIDEDDHGKSTAFARVTPHRP